MSINTIPTFDVLTIDVDDPLASVFSKYTDVFGIKTYATLAVDDLKLKHASTILAEYLDNNEDGVVDSRLVVQSMSNINATMVMFKDELEQEGSALDQISVQNINFQNLWDAETHLNGAAKGLFDASLEEILHLITDYGYAQAYPSALSVTNRSQLTNAMDIARGGNFTEVPAQYPSDAWYTYYDETSDYSTQATEYFYWALTSYLGGQQFDGRREQIADEWSLNTKELFQSTDTAMFAIISDEQLSLPNILPDGIYNVSTTGADSSGIEYKEGYVYRLRNDSTGKFIFSANSGEIDIITGQGWVNEGAAYASPTNATIDLHRFLMSNGGHFYTANTIEKNILSQDSLFTYEGVAYQVYSTAEPPQGSTPVVRYFSIAGSHLYSTSQYEQSILDASDQWLNEGIAWYGEAL